MGTYRLNESGEWQRVWPEPQPDPEPELSMADYIKRANQEHDPELAAQKHRWKMQGEPLPGGRRGGGKGGFVYVIQDNQSGLYKIGRTNDMDRRMRELGVGTSARLVSSKKVDDAAAVERAAHKRYKDSRLPQTEYFRLDTPPVV